MERIYAKKLGELRDEVFAKLHETIVNRGMPLGTRKVLYLYNPDNETQVNISPTGYEAEACEERPVVWSLQAYEKTRFPMWVITDEEDYAMSDLSTDDAVSILERALDITDEEIKECSEWYHSERIHR